MPTSASSDSTSTMTGAVATIEEARQARQQRLAQRADRGSTGSTSTVTCQHHPRGDEPVRARSAAPGTRRRGEGMHRRMGRRQVATACAACIMAGAACRRATVRRGIGFVTREQLREGSLAHFRPARRRPQRHADRGRRREALRADARAAARGEWKSGIPRPNRPSLKIGTEQAGSLARVRLFL